MLTRSMFLAIATIALASCTTTQLSEREINLPQATSNATVQLVDLKNTNAPSSKFVVHGLENTVEHFPALSSTTEDILGSAFSSVDVVPNTQQSGTTLVLRDFSIRAISINEFDLYTISSRATADVFSDGQLIASYAGASDIRWSKFSGSGFQTANSQSTALAISRAIEGAIKAASLSSAQSKKAQGCTDTNFMITTAKEYRARERTNIKTLKSFVCNSYTKADALLYSAVALEDRDLIKKLLIAETDPSRLGPTGLSALHLAALSSSPEIVQLLSAYASSKAIRNHDGLTPRDIATLRDRIEILSWL